jgi:RNA-directed DNA polymerase
MESVKGWQSSESGTPQGAVISPLLASIYLDPLDWEMERAGLAMVRYADDFVVLCQSEEQARQALETEGKLLSEQSESKPKRDETATDDTRIMIFSIASY